MVGRNGSGKSSFAEAVEFALTGGNARWDGRTEVWRDGWRNLHDGQDASVAAQFTIDGESGTTVAERRWTDDADLDEASSSVRGPAGPTSLASLGWEDGVATGCEFEIAVEFGDGASGQQQVSGGPWARSRRACTPTTSLAPTR